MEIITGYRGEGHVTSQQNRITNIGIFGSGTFIIGNVGSLMAASVISANEVQIADGLLIAEGCTAEIPRGTSESLAIENGSQGTKRKDLIVARYTRESGTRIESMELVVITGTPASSNPAAPSYNTGSITGGDTLVDFPLFTVNIDGITIESVTRLVGYAEVSSKSYVDAINTTLTNLINTTKNNLQSAINTLSSTLSTVSGRVGTATLNTTAKNALAAINELLGKINTLTTNLSTTNSNVTAANNRINTANSNITAVANRASALETKTAGLVRVITYDVAANSNNYKQLNAGGMYKLILNGGTTSNTVRGEYLIGVTGGKALGIKALSAATIAEVTDGGSGLLKVHNTGSVVLRATLITTYGS